MKTLKNQFSDSVIKPSERARLSVEWCNMASINNRSYHDFLFNFAVNKRLAIYDNGGKTFDRITILFLDQKRTGYHGEVLFEGIGSSITGSGFFQHIEASKGRHLGKRITFDQMDENLQRILLNELIN